jgi:ribosomal protein L11 methyltransferase
VHWLEVSLVVNGELAEAVAEVLERFAPNGVVTESTAVVANDDDSEGRAIGPYRVAAYLLADEQLEATRQKLEESLWYLGRIQPLPPAQYRLVQQSDWAEAWKEHFHPVLLGQRLIIVPAWLESPAPERVAVRIEPGMAFGTGTHPTTQLCLEFIEAFFRHRAEESPHDAPTVIDIGCGSGILAVAALKLGACQALGVDIDPEAVTAARENAALNGETARLQIAAGSVQEVRAGAFALRQAPLVLANILAPVIIRLLAEGLGDLLAPGGWLVLSGILAEQSGQVVASLENYGLKLLAQRQEGDWVALIAGAV